MSLKKQLLGQDLWSGIGRPAASMAFAAGRAAAAAPSRPRRNPAIGIQGKRGQYRLAVRIQESVPGMDEVVHKIRTTSRTEVDVRIVGELFKQKPWHQKKNRPLRVGGSIGHVKITAGTLGCFVSRGGEDLILSNNHVLANENDARKGDKIIQPGDADGGKNPRDVVGLLDRFVKLKKTKNLVDAATASLIDDMEYYYNWLERLGEIRGVRTDMPDEGETVYKVGRTTGLTKGRVSAFGIDSLDIGYDMGVIMFDEQFEIEPTENKPFSLGGDSGSLIVDSRRRALGLLFAGNDVNATYANPIGTVLDKLKVDLVF